MRNEKGQFVKIAIKFKKCNNCGIDFPKNRKLSPRQWAEVKHCSRRCAGITRSETYVPSIETVEKIKIAKTGQPTKVKGSNHPNWKGGITPIRKKAYFSKEYKDWRKSVFERDNYTCQHCGQKGGELNADHIKPWAFFPELRFELSNGRTLCVECHRKTETWGNRKNKISLTLIGQDI